MHQVEILAIQYVKNVYRYYGYEPDMWRFAHRLGLCVAWGQKTYMDGDTIVLGCECRSSRKIATAAIRHEIAHHLIRKSGADKRLLKLRCSYEEGVKHIEKMVFHSELVLQIPDKIYLAALKKYGNSPQAILYMCEKTDASLSDALRRWVYAEVGEKRGAFVFQRGLIVDIAAANVWMPFWFWDEVDDPLYRLPNATMLALPPEWREYGRDCELGLVGW